MSKIALSAALATTVVFQAVGITPLSAGERSVLVQKTKPLVTRASASKKSGSKQVKLKWRKRQPTRGAKADSRGAADRSQVVTASGSDLPAGPPRLVAPEALIPGRVSAPRMLPTAERTPTVPLSSPRFQLAQDTRSDKSSDLDDQAAPSIDDLFNDLPNDPPNDPPGTLPIRPNPTPEAFPFQPDAGQILPEDDEIPLTEEEEAQKCRDLATLRDQEINGTDKQQGAIEYCEQSRREINNLDHRVVNLSIDISPPKPLGGFNCDRDWRDITGKILLRGRPDNYDVISRTITIKSPDGKLHQLQFDELALADRKQFLAMYRLPMDCTIVGQGSLAKPRHWAPSTFTWTASALCSKPNYFEEVHLERYGHSPGPIIGPIVSSAHFFATFPVLPYKMGLTPPSECVYTLGYYRPGNCAPYLLDPIPLSVRAGLWQAGAWVGGVFLIP